MSETRNRWPTDWPVRSLEKIASLITSGGTPTSGSPRYYLEYGGLPFAKTEDLTRAGSRFIEECELGISEVALKETAAKKYPAGTVLISMYGTIGLTKIAAAQMAANQALCALIPPLACDSGYLYHHLEYIRPGWLKYSGQTTQANINGATVRAHEVPLPEPSEQRKIAEVLDTLDTAINETEAIIAKLKAVKQGLLHDLLTRGIDANGELRPPQAEAPHLYKESPLGWIPKEWEAVTLSACSLKIADRDHTTPRYIEDGVLIVSPTNLHGDEGIDFVSSKRISRRAHEINCKKTDLAPGDIILHRIGAGLGRVRLVTADMPEFSILHSMAQIRPDLSEMTSHFMLWAMRIDSTKNQMGLGTQSIGVPDLGLDKISNFIVPKPPLEEQRQIASRLVALQTRIDADSNDFAKLAALKYGLMDDLLTGRVRVTPLLAEAAKQPGCA